MNEERERLLARWQELGDRDALGALLFDEAKAIKAVLLRRGAGRASAAQSVSDIVQEAGLRYLEKKQRNGVPIFPNVVALRGYLLKIAWGMCVDRYRRAGRRPLRIENAGTNSIGFDPATSGGFGEVEHVEFKHALQLAMNILPEAEQRVVELYDLKYKSYAVIARELGLPTADAARMRRKRALKQLAPLLKQWLDILA